MADSLSLWVKCVNHRKAKIRPNKIRSALRISLGNVPHFPVFPGLFFKKKKKIRRHLILDTNGPNLKRSEFFKLHGRLTIGASFELSEVLRPEICTD